MQQITLTMRPVDGSFEVPYSTGYQTYSGLLSVLDAVDDDVADELHDTSFTALSNSGLLGSFGRGANRDYHKVVRGGSDYELQLGIVHPGDREVFEALIKAFVIEDRNLPLAHGELTVEEVSSDRTNQEEMLESAAQAAPDANGVRMTFQSPTCRQRYGDVWEASPDRVALFQHLARRWNAVAEVPERELAPTADALGTGVYPVAEPDDYETYSIVVHRRDPSVENESERPQEAATDGGHLNEAQGFVGEWAYKFKDASEATQTAVLTLGQFAEYAGVGRHNARGAGSVTTDII